MYIENPKTKDSGIYCCIPQKGLCPRKCEDCFFQSGRSYLEPLSENTPNMPDESFVIENNIVVRVNDGNDSNNDPNLVRWETRNYPLKFFNTSYNHQLEKFFDPIVLTVNPGEMTDKDFYKLEEIPENLMFVRFRANTWNTVLTTKCIAYYTSRQVPVVLTFMAYWKYENTIPVQHARFYGKRTLNTYCAITHHGFDMVMRNWQNNALVHSCGIEGIDGGNKCKNCGNCLREFFATKTRMMSNGP